MFDSTSLEILKILQEKARIPNVEVSRKIGLAPSAVLERIRKLEKQDVIKGYEVRLNPEMFNCSLVAFVHVEVEPEQFEDVGRRLSEMAEVQEVHFVSGTDCYLLKIRTIDNESLGDLLQKKIRALQGVISTRSETVLSTIKESSRIPLPDTV